MLRATAAVTVDGLTHWVARASGVPFALLWFDLFTVKVQTVAARCGIVQPHRLLPLVGLFLRDLARKMRLQPGREGVAVAIVDAVAL